MRLRSGDKHHLRKSADREAQIRKAFVPLTELICAFRSADFLRWCLSPRAQPHAQSLFLHVFPIVLGIIMLLPEYARLSGTHAHSPAWRRMWKLGNTTFINMSAVMINECVPLALTGREHHSGQLATLRDSLLMSLQLRSCLCAVDVSTV